jgi:exodeoxyribonuclease VII large subunit
VTARVLPVGAFVCLFRELLEADPLYSDLWLEGEVSDFSRSSAGHIYFSLRDDDGCLKCVLFRGQVLRQTQLPSLGSQIAVHGGLSVYTRSGAVQLVADLIRPAGLGAAWLQLEYLRQRLALEGIFDTSRKRDLPPWPRAIGVVTSPHGAAWQDIQTVVRRRFPLASLTLAPAQVQGSGAAESIVSAIEALQFDAEVDVVIIARGGGGSDDLAAFNDERVVRAVFACQIPVAAGIGHATDRTLTEDAADVSAPTPSAAAELCVPSASELRERLLNLESRLSWSTAIHHQAARSAVEEASRRLLRLAPSARLDDRRRALEAWSLRLRRAVDGRMAERSRKVAEAGALLSALSPRGVLDRGYALLQTELDARPLFSVSQAPARTRVVAVLGDGSFHATVDARVESTRGTPLDQS